MRTAIFIVMACSLIAAPLVNSTLAASPVMAQGDIPNQEPPRPDPRFEIVRAYLQLDDAQFRSFLMLNQTRIETLEPLIRAVADRERQLAMLLREPRPEPAAIGRLVISIHGTRQRIGATEDHFRNGFRDILTEDQQRRLLGLERFIATQQAAPAFLSLGLIQIGPGVEPQATLFKVFGYDPAY